MRLIRRSPWRGRSSVLPLERQLAPILARRRPRAPPQPRPGARKRCAARRSSSSGSTSSLRATLTAAKSTSPSSVGADRLRPSQLAPARPVELGERAVERRGTRSRRPRRAAAPCGRRAAPAAPPGTSWKMPSRPSCSRLIRSQRPRTRSGGPCLGVAEHVRVPAHELLVHRRGHLRQVAGPSLLEQQREEVDLEEQVAELVEQLLVVAGERRVGDLVGLLDRVRDDRARGLLPVPGAVAAQPLASAAELERAAAGRRRGASDAQRIPLRWRPPVVVARASSASWSSPACSPSGTRPSP